MFSATEIIIGPLTTKQIIKLANRTAPYLEAATDVSPNDLFSV